jgi:DNA-binding NtrC family response regulator
LQELLAYPWPGNVRELRNVIEHVYAVSNGPALSWQSLPAQIRGRSGEPAIRVSHAAETSFREAKRRFVNEFERTYVQQMLASCDGNVSLAARKAGMHRQGFQRLLVRHRSVVRGS